MEEELDPTNIFVIRQKLGALNKAPGQNHFEYYVGHFKINIWLVKIQEHTSDDDNDNILNHAKVDVDLHEVSSREDRLYNWVHLDTDLRFKNYEPIQYLWTPSRHQIYANGEDMPILQLCELIKYLYRLSNLNVFM